MALPVMTGVPECSMCDRWAPVVHTISLPANDSILALCPACFTDAQTLRWSRIVRRRHLTVPHSPVTEEFLMNLYGSRHMSDRWTVYDYSIGAV